MAKRGIGITDIARNCGLHEGEVEVLLGMARLVKSRQTGAVNLTYRQIAAEL